MSETASAVGELSAEDKAYFDEGRKEEVADKATEGRKRWENRTGDKLPPAPHASEGPEHDEPAREEPEAPEQDGQKTVPHKALHEERQRRKDVEAKLQAAEVKRAEDMARLQERLDIIQQSYQQTAQQPQGPEPTFETDPYGYMRSLETRLNAAEQWRHQQEQQVQHRAQVSDLQTWAQQQENDFVKKEPTYLEATQWLRENRTRELNALGLTDPRAVAAALQNDVQQMVFAARQQGGNFAERVFSVARERGFRGSNVNAPAAASSAVSGADEGRRADTITRGQELSRTVGTGGNAPEPNLSVNKLLEMDDEDFAKAFKADKRVKRMFGA